MNDVFIIAEAGVNHNGSLALAKKLIDVASNAGADAVKFQTFNAEKLVSRHAAKAQYQKSRTHVNESHYEMLKKLELDESAHYELIKYCNEKKIIFLSSPFDHDSIDLLNRLDIPIFKIPSGEITNLLYLRHVGTLGKRIFLSTGMSTLSEIHEALKVLIEAGTSKDLITILHATTEYPCPKDEVNLRAMQTISSAFNVNVGYSDHTQGIEISLAAVAMGAKVIEKHFTLDRTMEGPDHLASLEPGELNAMVRGIRQISHALGDGIKRPSKSELKNIGIARKSIVAGRAIRVGEIFSSDNLAVKRPGSGISPMYWDSLLGTVSKKSYKKDDLI